MRNFPENQTQQPDSSSENLAKIDETIEKELEKYETLLSKENVSSGEELAYGNNIQFLQDSLLVVDDAKRWMESNQGKGWDDYIDIKVKIWKDKMENSPDKLKDGAEKKYAFYRKVGSKFAEHDFENEEQETESPDTEKARKLFEAFERGGGSPEVQEAKLKVNDLIEETEKARTQMARDKIEGKVSLYDDEDISWFETELKLWKRQAEGRSVEGETKEENEEYRKHVGAMSKEEIRKSREHIKKMKSA